MSVKNEERASKKKTEIDSGRRPVATRPEGTSEGNRWSAHRNHKPYEPYSVMTNRAAIELLPVQRPVCHIRLR